MRELKSSERNRKAREYSTERRKDPAYRAKMRVYLKEYYRNNRFRYRRARGIHISDEAANALLESQNFKCAICGTPQDQLRSTLCVDHDHGTGRIRGLLCHGCNLGIGNMKDNIEIVRAAVAYLERTSR